MPQDLGLRFVKKLMLDYGLPNRGNEPEACDDCVLDERFF
jgi:hypothetical protein